MRKHDSRTSMGSSRERAIQKLAKGSSSVAKCHIDTLETLTTGRSITTRLATRLHILQRNNTSCTAITRLATKQHVLPCNTMSYSALTRLATQCHVMTQNTTSCSAITHLHFETPLIFYLDNILPGTFVWDLICGT